MDAYALYFDGQNSKPQKVELERVSTTRLRVYTSNDRQEYFDWTYADCEIDSLNSGENIQISYGTFPKEIIEFSQNTYPKIAENLMSSQPELTSFYQKIKSFNPIRVMAYGLGSIFVLSFLYIQYISPWIGNQVVQFIPESVEVKIGMALSNNLVGFEDVDTIKSEYLMAFYKECGYTSSYPIDIKYIESGVVNAFAAPGGQIMIYEGIVDIMDCHDQLAGLIAHELAHVNERHSMKILARASSNYLILSALTGDVAGASSVILEQASQLNELANSRSAEREADESGLAYMIDHDVDPFGMVNLFSALYEETTGIFSDSSKVKEVLENVESFDFMSTHPSTQKRIDNMRRKSREFNPEREYNDKLDSLWHLIQTQSPEE